MLYVSGNSHLNNCLVYYVCQCGGKKIMCHVTVGFKIQNNNKKKHAGYFGISLELSSKNTKGNHGLV